MNLKKKIVALGMVCALAVGMATSAFAADYSGQQYFFKAYGGAGSVLNTWSSSVKAGDPIRLFNFTGDASQKWVLVRNSSDGTYSIRVKANTYYAINRSNGSGHAILWDWINGQADSNMSLNDHNSGGKTFTFHLAGGAHKWEYLRAEGSGYGAYVSFGPAYNGNDARVLWTQYIP